MHFMRIFYRSKIAQLNIINEIIFRKVENRISFQILLISQQSLKKKENHLV